MIIDIPEESNIPDNLAPGYQPGVFAIGKTLTIPKWSFLLILSSITAKTTSCPKGWITIYSIRNNLSSHINTAKAN